MTLAIPYNHEKKLDDQQPYKLNIKVAIFTTLIISLGIAIATLYGSSIFSDSIRSLLVSPASTVDLGTVNGFVMSSDGLPVDGASVLVYKHMGLTTSADKNAGYSSSEITRHDGSYVLDNLPSGVYKFVVTYPDETIQTVDNYAVWPSSDSSYIFGETK